MLRLIHAWFAGWAAASAGESMLSHPAFASFSALEQWAYDAGKRAFYSGINSWEEDDGSYRTSDA